MQKGYRKVVILALCSHSMARETAIIQISSQTPLLHSIILYGSIFFCCFCFIIIYLFYLVS